MADGPYRFQPNGSQHYYQQFNHQVHQPRHLARSGSPVNNGRPNYPNETPSPSRSPVSQASNHNPFSIFGQHNQSQNMMNGVSNQQRYMQMNNHNKFHHPGHQQHHGQQNHQQHNHTTHPGQGAMNHQHTYSSGMLSSATPSFTPRGVSGRVSNQNQEDVDEQLPEHWQNQLQQAAEARASLVTPHHHARKTGATSSAHVKSTSPQEEPHRDRPAIDRRTLTESTWDGLDLSGQGFRYLAADIFHYDFLDKLYIDGNKLKFLPPAIKALRNLSLLDASNNELISLPPEIGTLLSLTTLRLFYNQIRTLPSQVGYLFRLDFLGLEGNPLNEEQKDLLYRGGTKSLVLHLRDSSEIPPPPNAREIVVIDDDQAQETVTVLDYNTLCERYATANQYRYTPTKALAWSYRRKLILDEIINRDADVVCMQELDQENYLDFFTPALQSRGYSGNYYQKGRARVMQEKEARSVDGCATFFKKSKFICLSKDFIEFANSAINRSDMKGEDDIFNRVMPHDQIASINFLENRRTGTRFIVGNAHIFWDPVYEDVKVVQVAILLERLAKLADDWAKRPACGLAQKRAYTSLRQDGEEGGEELSDESLEDFKPSQEYTSGNQIPLILCGDYNAERRTAVCDLLENGSLSRDHKVLANRSYGNFTKNGITHPFKLKSAYQDSSMEFTNYTPGYTGHIDYIWYSPSSLRLKKILGEIDLDHVLALPGFPMFHFPSDHLPLYAELAVEPRRERRVVEVDFGGGGRER